MSRILFLDIDGVLNSHTYFEQTRDERHRIEGRCSIKDDECWTSMLDPQAIGILNRIIKETNARTVISSSWRHAHRWSTIERYLKMRGFKGHVIGQTPNITKPSVRGDEIDKWLKNNKGMRVTNYAILDDDADMAHLVHRHVQTDLNVGLTNRDADKVIELLNEE